MTPSEFAKSELKNLLAVATPTALKVPPTSKNQPADMDMSVSEASIASARNS
jgi:hypothetical protein